MPGFSDYESPQEFKDRLNCLTEKLKRISQNLSQVPRKINTDAEAINSSISSNRGEQIRLK